MNAASAQNGQVHHFTVDVEEYFHPTALAPYYPMSEWDSLERRASHVVPRILAFLAERDVTATFFVLGWLAEREPEVVRSIAEAGHEIASHGWEHELVGRLGPDGFAESIGKSKAVLEDVTGVTVSGYRAPSFSIVPGLEWAFDALLAAGYRYDASLFPVTQHPTYGYPDADRSPFLLRREQGVLVEIPTTTAEVFGSTLPAGGGAYFRFLPYALIRTGLRQAEARGAPGIFYIHPWELDDWAPDVDAPFVSRLRTFGRRHRTWPRLDRMFRDFRFGRVDVTVAEMLASEGD